MPGLTDEQKKKLDSNIQAMVAQGASQEDIMSYATDFKKKYGAEIQTQQNDNQNDQFLNFGETVAPKQKVPKGMGTLIQAHTPPPIKPKASTSEPDIKEAIDNTVNNYLKNDRGVYDKTLPPPTKEEIQRQKDIVIQEYKNGRLVPEKNSDGTTVMKRGTGFFESLLNATQEAHTKNMEDKWLSSLSKEDAIHYLNTDRAHPGLLFNKDRETAPSGIGGDIGESIGKNSEFIAKAFTGAIAGLSTEFTGAAGFGTFVATSQDIAASGYSTALRNNYNALKNQDPNISDEEAFDKAQKAAYANEAIQLGVNAVLSKSVPENIPAPKISTKGVVNAVAESLKHTVATAPKVIGATVGGSLASDLSNKLAGIDVSLSESLNNAVEQSKGMAIMHFGLGVLGASVNGLKESIPPYVRPQIENMVASAPREEVQRYFANQEATGDMPLGTTQKVLDKLSEFDQQKAIVDKLPLPEENKAAITGKLIQRKDLIDQREELAKYGSSFNEQIASIDNKIKNVESDINGITKSSNPFEFERDNLTGESAVQPEPIKTEPTTKPVSSIEDKQGIWNNTGTKFDNNKFTAKDGNEYIIKHKPDSEGGQVWVEDNNENRLATATFTNEKDGSIGVDYITSDRKKIGFGNALMDYISNNIGIAHLGKTRTEEGKIFANSNLSKNKSNETKAQAKEPNIKAVEGSDQSNEPIPTGKRGEAETTIPTTTQTEKIGGQDATQTGKIPTSNLAEYPNRDTSGQTAETSGSNSNVSSGEIKPEIPQQEEVTQQGGNNVGVSHAALTDLAKRLNLDEPQRGAYIEPEMYADRGRKLLAAGADPNEINNPNNTLHDRIAIGRAHLEDLTKIADAMAKKWGVDSPQFEEAQRAVNDYSKQIKELGTDAHRAMVSLQGNRDLDTDSFTAVKTEVENNSGRKLNATQQKKIEQLTTENQKLKQQAEEAEAKLIEETEKAFQAGVEEGKKKTTSQKAKTVANKLREAAKLSKPGTFSAASPASLVWDTAVEAVAKSIEAGGKIAEAIEEGLKLIRESDWYKGITDDKKQKAEQEFKQFNFDNTGSSNLEDLQARFLDKKGNKFTREEAKDVWAYTKENYLDKGVSYRDAIINVSNDLGLSWRQVNEAISTPKTKRISDEMWKKQADYRRNQNATKTWIDDQEKNPAFKAIKKISDKFRAVAVFGHGGIFMGTHAGMTLFQPTTWDKTIPAFFRGWKFAYGKVANHERAMEELKNRENYVIAQRAGLKNNPDRVNVEEYQKSQSYLGKLGGAGERGFNAIKVLRQDLFDYHYNRLNDVEKADPKAVEQIAKLVNLATGATNLNIPEWINEVTFAGGMEAARWGKLTRSPINATTTALRALYAPDKVSLEDKVFAKVWASRVGQQLATFTSLLLANAALQNYLNPKNPVNLTDPTKPDLFKFKVGDLTIDPTSGMRSAGMFIYGIGKIPFEQQKELHGDTRLQAASKSVFSYGRGKLSPAYSTLADFYTGQDYNKNPLPFSSDKPTAGHHKLTWGEYLWQKAPLPIAEAATVTYKSAEDHGADKPTLNNILTGIVSGAISGSTGFRVGEYNAEESNHSPFTDEDKKDPTFKFFIDKGLNLPNTSLSSETVPGTDNKIADYPKEVQDKYIKAHKEALKEELQNIKENGIVYVTKNKTLRGEIVTHVAIDEPDNDNYTEVKIDDLTTEELAQLLSIAQSQATKQAKEEVFNNDEQ